MTKYLFTVLLGGALALGGCVHRTAPAPVAAFTSANPFYSPSTLPFHAPPFDRIHDSDYQPAIEEGMRQELADVERIADQSAPPTFDNTLVALERTGALLYRVNRVFNGITQANTDTALQRIQTEEAPRLAAHADAIHLNPKLFERIRSIYDRRDALGLTAVQKRLVERDYLDFVRSGALLSDADKAKLRALNQEESKLSTDFQNRLLAATKESAVIVSDSTQLAGMSADDIASAADAAKQRGLTGKWVLLLQNTTQQPFEAELANRAEREKLFDASITRAEHNDSADTRSDIQRLAQLRAEKAKLLGYPAYADYILADQMAKTPAAAIGLLDRLVPPATARARAEAEDMQKLVDQEHGGFRLGPYDWPYFSEKVRKARYDLDESQLRPYFELNRVLNDGVFYAAHQLYGLTFKERKDIPVYHPDVRVFEVFDLGGKPLALWYADYFKRDEKSGGAWEDSFVDQSGLMGTKAVIYNVANFTKPAPGQPALLTFDDVTTMFHEFGHALHAILSNVEYPTLAGTNVPRDFVEFPSQFNEHWALDNNVLAHYARHYKTDAPMPAELVTKIKKASTFNQGYATTEYLAASLLDMAWHTLPPDAPLMPVDSFETAALERYHVAMPLVPPRYRSSYFLHIWSNGYAAGYYAYMWSEVLDDDAYQWFVEHGGLTRANGQRFRDMVLSRGSTEDLSAMYRAFRGRDPTIEALLEQRGLKGEPQER